MAEFTGLLIRFHKTQISRVFDVAVAIERSINAMRKKHRPGNMVDAEFHQGYPLIRIRSAPLTLLNVEFNIGNDSRSLSVWFDYTDLPEDQRGPNIYLYIGEWGGYREILDTVAGAINDALSKGIIKQEDSHG
jgi:hypothetical protein